MTRYHETVDILHRKLLDLRSIELMIKTTLFERMYDECVDKDNVDKYIYSGNRHKLSGWIDKSYKLLALGERPVRVLREEARRLGILNYSRLTKRELILGIERHEKSGDDRVHKTGT